jgi:uncharacterized surface protein with fasciclin (FAS1) repeats
MKSILFAAGAVLALATAPAVAGGTRPTATAPATPERGSAPTASAGSAVGNLVTVAKADSQLSTFARAAEAAGLEQLTGTTHVTVFAPTDAAFAKLPAGTVDRLLQPENREQLRTLLANHIVPGHATAEFLSGKQGAMKTAGGAEVSIDGRQGVTFGGATVVRPDIAASNGVIHAIDTVVMDGASSASAAAAASLESTERSGR